MFFIAWWAMGIIGALAIVGGDKNMTRRLYPSQYKSWRRINVLWALVLGLAGPIVVLGAVIAVPCFLLSGRNWNGTALERWLDQPLRKL